MCNREINGRTIIERNTRLCDRRGGEKRMNYEQLIEELREEMLQLVNTKCDALLQMYRSGEVHTSVKNPTGKKIDCHRDTKIDPKTIRKWW